MKNKTCSVCLEKVDINIVYTNHDHKVQIDGLEFTYSLFYDRLTVEQKDNNPIVGSVRCARCHNDNFRISYGDYECIANCTCGHSFTIYDG